MNPTRNIVLCSEHSLASVVTFTDLNPVKHSAPHLEPERSIKYLEW